MKKILGILAISLLISCSQDETVNTNIIDCNCWTVISCTYITIVGGNGTISNTRVYSSEVRNDCTFQIKRIPIQTVVNQKICNGLKQIN